MAPTSPRREVPRRSRWRGWAALVALLTVPGALWSLASPLFSVPDEPSHSITAVALWNGDRGGEDLVFPDGHVVTLYELPRYWVDSSGYPVCFAHHPDVTADCASGRPATTGPSVAGSSAGHYPPLFYALVGWPGRLWPDATGAHLMRLLSALACAGLLAVAVRALAGVVGSPLALTGVLVAAVPMVWFLAGSVNPNGLEAASATAVWALLLALVHGPATPGPQGPPRSLVVQLVGAGVVLAFTRPLSPVLLVAIVALVAVSGAPAALWRLGRAPVVRRGGAVLAGAAILAAVLVARSGVLGSTPASVAVEDRNPLFAVLGRTDTYLRQMVGWFGWLDSPAPSLTVYLWVGMAGALVVLSTVLVRWRAWLGLALTVAATVVLPVAAQYPSATTRGLPWQGRYTLPVWVGVPMTACVLIGTRPGVPPGALRRLGVVLTAGSAVGGLAAFAWALRRYATGAHGSFDLLGAEWQPPGGAVLLIVGMLVFCTGTVWMVARPPTWLGPAEPGGDPAEVPAPS